jgi:uncharacterized repeat protein (TIGR01451 family)
MALTLASLIPFSFAEAALVSKTITVNGNMADWNGIRDNPGQYTEDAEGAVDPTDRDYVVQATGRDLKKFAVTWDATSLYFYIERFASTSNKTDWWFYLDVNNDRMLQDGEYVLQVNWQGSNRSTNRMLWRYDAANDATGDPLEDPGTGFADGYDMPGSIYAKNGLPGNLKGGASSGVEMESFINWSDLGFAGPTSFGFHIASSNGTNLPTQVDDNMDGPGNNALVFSDLALAKSVVPVSAAAGEVVTFTLTLTNAGPGGVFGPTVLDDLAAAGLTYVADDASASGTSYDPVTGLWTLGPVPAGGSVTLNVQATATPANPPQTFTNNAAIVAGVADADPANDTAQASVAFGPGANLNLVKSLLTVRDEVNGTANPKSIPGAWLDYTLDVSNDGAAAADNVVVIDALPTDVALYVGDLDGNGSPLEFIDGDGAGNDLSGLSFTFTSLASTSDDVDFSANDGADGFTYLPQPDAEGFDSNVTTLRIAPAGSLQASTVASTPRARFRLRVRLQ